MNVSAQENALPQEEKAGGNQEQPRITGNADEIGAAESNVKAILSSVYIANPELGTPGLLAPASVKVSDSFSRGEGKDEEASVSVMVELPGLSSITVPRLRQEVTDALFTIPFINEHFSKGGKVSPFDIDKQVKGLIEEAIPGLSADKQEMLQQWLKNRSNKNGGAPIYYGNFGSAQSPSVNEDQDNCLSLSFSVTGNHPTEKDINATRFVLENIETLKPSILQKIQALVEEKNKEHLERDGKSLFTEEEINQIKKADLDITDTSGQFGGTVTVTLGTRTEGEKKLAATPLSKLDGKIIGKIIDDAVMSEGENVNEMFGLVATPKQAFDKLGELITDPDLKKKHDELVTKIEEEQRRWDSGRDDKEGKPPIRIERAGDPFTRGPSPADTLEISFSVPKGKTYADIIKAIAGYEAAVANDNIQEKGDALGALIKAAANGRQVHREDGDGDDKPKGPLGSPGDDEPKPGGDALAAANDGNKGSISVNTKKAGDYGDALKQPGGYETAANSDAANSNIAAAEAELKGRVNDTKERHVG